ncbi:MAG TPA: hypothetical protein VJM06_07355 [Gaiellaceae bacterium]|nr:hypothetical protein [Gaiellaceae bacterium]
MSTLAPSSRRARPPQRSRRAVIGRAVLVVVGLTLAFLLGIAFARTLDERPESGGAETIVRTLTPLPQDAPTRTVTVTVTTTP